VVAGELAFAVGHEGGLVRLDHADEVHQVVEGVAFDVVFGLRPFAQQRGQLVHVVRADVAFVGPRVHGDAVGAGLQAQRGGAHDAGDAQVARVAQQGHLVDVDRQRSAPAVAGVGVPVRRRGVHAVGARFRPGAARRAAPGACAVGVAQMIVKQFAQRPAQGRRVAAQAWRSAAAWPLPAAWASAASSATQVRPGRPCVVGHHAGFGVQRVARVGLHRAGGERGAGQVGQQAQFTQQQQFKGPQHGGLRRPPPASAASVSA
jgi:hypothetical protein